MKFGKEFKSHQEETLPEWRDKFFCYKPLKKLLKHFPAITVESLPTHLYQPSSNAAAAASDDVDVRQQDRPFEDTHDWFVRILNEELEKFNDFYVDKEEEFVIRFQELKLRIEALRERSSQDGSFTSDGEFSKEMMDIRKDFVTIHGEMVLLKNYSSLNFAALVKILKKYDKRTGGLLRLPFTQLAAHQPFFITESLTRLVCECEENLELLFPIEAEVIESTTTEGRSIPPQKNTSSAEPEARTTLGEETVDIYRSTLAAMKAIRGLRKESSTCNPLSFSTLIRSQDDDSTGALTAEDSDSNSLGSLLNQDDN